MKHHHDFPSLQRTSVPKASRDRTAHQRSTHVSTPRLQNAAAGSQRAGVSCTDVSRLAIHALLLSINPLPAKVHESLSRQKALHVKAPRDVQTHILSIDLGVIPSFFRSFRAVGRHQSHGARVRSHHVHNREKVRHSLAARNPTQNGIQSIRGCSNEMHGHWSDLPRGESRPRR